ncbi:M42 family metallopeptidase [Dehalobacter sp. TBBPA1]|uniref:M42 family metallopeptidase n=1 Tax=Dehalobacter sp. TBBPA1 TaxID=3235037 RepID=UPI0034A4FE61
MTDTKPLDSLDFTLLQQLTQTFGPSGQEHNVAALILDQTKNDADTAYTDTLGNLIVRKKGQGKKMMIACHMDEVGIMVTHINKQGYLYFAPVGGLRDHVLLAQRFVFANGAVGVVSREEKKKPDENSPERLFLDLGATSEQEARTMVREGDMAVFSGAYHETKDCMISKALDNRAGCFIALEVLKRVSSQDDLYFVFTAQEEVGARGAKTAAYALEPDLALNIDTTFSFDMPREYEVPRTSLNKGIAIKVMDRSIVVSPQIKNWMAEIAEQHEIPYQWEIITKGGTDSGPVHLTKGGIPTGGLAVPVRHLHTPGEIASKNDIRSGISLLLALLE